MLLQDPRDKVSCQLRTPHCLMGKTDTIDSPLNRVKSKICSKMTNDGYHSVLINIQEGAMAGEIQESLSFSV